MILNEEQQAAVNVREGQYAVAAGPGSGKTTVLVSRYRALIEDEYSPHDILSVTFTREAAENMLRKAGATKEQFTTFHSLGYRICNIENGRQNVEPELRHRLLSNLANKYKLEYKAIAAYISKCRRNEITPEQAAQEDGTFKYGLPSAYREYEEERLRAGWADFDSMLADSLALLKKPEIRARYQFPWIMVDEAQDCEKIQYDIVKLLSEKYQNVFFVGDFQQAIYGFRDAVVDFESTMRNIWPSTKTLYLGKNYRSHPTLVSYLKKKSPSSAMSERMHSARPDNGIEIEYRMFNNEADEAESAIACALKDPKNSAILTRTNRMLAPLENLCLTNNISFHLLGRSGFWKQSEVLRAVEKLRKTPDLSLPTAVNLLWPQLESHYQVEDMTEKDNDALENLKTLRDISKKFNRVAEFVGYANRAAHARQSTRGITLSTVHQAKGQEYTNVFVVGCRSGMIPHDKGDLDEERRIFFVACSRAKDRLRLSFVGTPSMFIRPEVTPEVLQKLETNRDKVERIKS